MSFLRYVVRFPLFWSGAGLFRYQIRSDHGNTLIDFRFCPSFHIYICKELTRPTIWISWFHPKPFCREHFILNQLTEKCPKQWVDLCDISICSSCCTFCLLMLEKHSELSSMRAAVLSLGPFPLAIKNFQLTVGYPNVLHVLAVELNRLVFSKAEFHFYLETVFWGCVIHTL